MKDELICETGVKRAIDAQRASYVVPDSSVLGGYIQRSRECIAQYNGRQIFEMLQNVDDQLDAAVETERECRITLDKDAGRLSFRNKGKPFTVKGVKSIMYPDSSPKRIDKLPTIGNKGLGFRSLLNWNPTAIVIRSNETELLFSPSVLQEDYLKQDKELLRAMEDAHEDQLPILTFPRINKWNGASDGWVTEIELLGVQNAAKDIEEELLNFKSELMLFLPHLRKVSIEIIANGQKNEVTYFAGKRQPILNAELHLQKRVISKSFNDTTETTTWLICWRRGELVEDGKPAQYNVEVGVPCSGKSADKFEGVLYNYLPTKVRVKLPCLVHATVKLEDHRNALVTRNALNAKICGEIIPNVIVSLALAIKDNKLVDDKWLPFSLLSAPVDCDDREYIGKMYCQLRAALVKQQICPCVDGKWHTLDDSLFCAPAAFDKCCITDFFNDHPCFLSNYVCRGMPEELAGFKCVQITNADVLRKKINDELCKPDSRGKYSIKELTDLIYILWQLVQRGLKITGPYWLLRDDNENIFDEDTQIVYTPVSADPIKLPEYMKADFVAADQWAEITSRFSREIDQVAFADEGTKDVAHNKERAFCTRILRNTLGLRVDYYDRHNVAQQMVRLVRQKINGEQMDVAGKRNLIRQLFCALLENYRVDAEPGSRTDDVPLSVDDVGNILNANDFLFEKAREAYGTLLPNSVFLNKVKMDSLFEGINTDVDREKFLRYLGVRGDVRVCYRDIKSNAGRTDSYLLFLQRMGVDRGGLPEASHTYDALKTSLSVVTVRDLSVLKVLPTSQFFKLFGLEREDGICELIDVEPGSISWNAVNGRESSYNPYQVRWSYVAYQLHECFSGVIFGENDKVLSDLGWRFEQNQQGIPSSVLVKLGAKNKLADLSPDELYGLVNRIAESDPTKRPTKDFYKKINAALTTLEERGVLVNPPKNLKVYADGLGFRLASTVFYHDNPAHAKLLVQDRPMMYLSSRVGVDKVCRHFGVKKLDESDIALGAYTKVERILQDKFDQYFLSKASLLGILLCQRRSQTLEDSQREIAGVQINLVRSMRYAYGRNNQPDSVLAEFAYLREPNEGRRVFYLNVGSCEDLNTLPHDECRKFYGALSGILCDAVRLSDELLDRQFYECFADEEKTRLDLVDAGYLDDVNDLRSAIQKNYYAHHIAAMRNIADTVFVKSVKPAVWKYLSGKPNLQEDYVQYEPAYHASIEKLLADGGEIASVCLENQNTEWNDIDLRKVFLTHFARINWWQDLQRPLPEDWTIENDDANDAKEPVPAELYPALWSEEIEDSRIISLFYFYENAERITAKLKEKQQNEATAAGKPADDDIKLLNRMQTDIGFKRPKAAVTFGSTKKGSGQAMTERRMRNQKTKGDRAERLVEYWLNEAPENKNLISNVERVSGTSHGSSRNDALHFDIRYIKQGVMHYVEVKACDSGEFHISPGELKFAEEHPETYHLALVYVDTNEVKVVDDVFRKLANVRIPDGWKVAVEK